MKIILISLFCLFLIGITSYSYAQYYAYVSAGTKVPEVMLQLVMRDSEGNLITYIEAEQILEFYPDRLKKFLDNLNYKEFLIKDGKAYEKFHWQGNTENFDKQHVWNQFNLWTTDQSGTPVVVLVVRHNGYQSQPGDTILVYWTVVRPAS